MNSGRFDKLTGRKRPGTYINVDANASPAVTYGARGNVLIPLVNNWGPNATILKIKAEDITAYDAQLGNSVGNILLVSEAFKGASTVYVYNINKGSKAAKTITLAEASGDDPAVTLTCTAKYNGTRGNDLKVKSVANTDSTFDVTVILGTEIVEEFTGLTTIAGLADAGSEYIDFTGTEGGDLAAFASTSLTGGTSSDPISSDISTMLDAAENENISAMAFPFTDSSLKAAAVSKAVYLRDSLGKVFQIVVCDYAAADYEGVINVTNSYQLTDGTQLTHAQATAFVAAITAAATELVSNTYKMVPDADTVIDKKTNEQAEAAIDAGEFFFTQDGDNVIVEYDINSLHTFTSKRTKTYSKNKVIRVYDAVSETIRLTFPPNRFPNSTTGWDLMDGLCQTILQHYKDEGAIQNVNLATDMRVNRGESSGDSVYVDARIHAVDAAEKLYFTVITD
ncbi:MAG: phage tail sheath family protein [Lachnospiraceae bacterium]|nr:phage tail sheath family protein [Lachnospiraceae bacterium]